MRLFARLILAFSALALCASAYAEAPFSFDKTPGKLPKDVVPLEYSFTIIPDLEAKTFRGEGSVLVQAKKPVSEIVLNALMLDIDSASLASPGKTPVKLDAVQDKEQQLVRLRLPQPLPAGRHTLAMTWRGIINREPLGLYYDRYRTATGEKIMLGSEMQPVDARRLLPLWDEPAYRARFKMSVELPAHFKAWSNMPVTKDEPRAGDRHLVTFDQTPPMPSYLLVLAAGELERNALRADGIELGIVTTEGKQDATAHALDASQALLRYYTSYFGLAYPLPKLDQIAVPGGTGGAMENWGAIIYSEPALLWDPKRGSEAARQGSFRTIAHEIAHQWFGNIVTMAWWDNLWLNEGFASWMAAKAADRLHPDWQVWLNASSDKELAMNMDARRGVHPVQRPIETEEQAANAFDAITYQKGQAFLRMLEAWLGEDNFRRGIQAYFKRHQYSNTTTADLWAALAQASGKPVARVAESWTLQPGFPLIQVEVACRNGQRHISLRQEQFKLDDKDPGERLWQVPLTLQVAGNIESHLLSARSMSLVRPGCRGAVLVDPDNAGYYRVQYDAEHHAALARRFHGLPAGARAKLLGDTWALLQAGRLPAEAWFALLPALQDEPRLALWRKALGDLETMAALVGDGPQRPALQRRVRELLAPAFARLGWDERATDNAEDRQLRPMLIGALAQAGDEAVVEEARARFARSLTDPASLNGSLAPVVTAIVGRYADAAMWNTLLELGTKAVRTDERQRYFRALASTRDPALAQKALQLALSDTLPPILVSGIVPAVAGSGHQAMAWSFAKLHHKTLVKTLDPIALQRYFPSVVRYAADPALAADMEAFVAQTQAPEAMVDAKRTADAIRNNAEFKARVLPQLEAVLR